MELSQYVSRAMARADRKGEKDYARFEGRQEGLLEGRNEVFSLLEKGMSLSDAKKHLGMQT